MSLILEALRKSEQQRRLGETPTLDQDATWAMRRWHGSRPRSARRPWLLLGFLLLALAFGLAGWRLGPSLIDAWKTPAPAVAPTSAQPKPATPSTTPPSVAQPSEPQAPPNPPTTQAPLPATPASLPTPQSGAAPTQANQTAPAPAAPALSDDGATPPAPPPANPASPTPTTPTPSVTPPPSVTTEPQPAPAAAETPASARDEVAAITPIYALPLATRQALPPLKMAMHVWNPDPRRRFVLIGETRAAEGESAASGVRVVEIRRDGVVMEFGQTRFLLPRDGW